MMKLQEDDQQQKKKILSSSAEEDLVESSSEQEDRRPLDKGWWLDQLDRQDLLLRGKDFHHKEEEDPLLVEEGEGVSPFLNYSTRRSKKRMSSSTTHRSLPQISSHFTLITPPTNNTATLTKNKVTMSTSSFTKKKNFFKQVLDPIDGSEDDLNSMRRNEAWKEICFMRDDDGGGGILGECYNGGIVSDDNVSGSEAETGYGRIVVQKKRKSYVEYENVSSSADSSSSFYSISDHDTGIRDEDKMDNNSSNCSVVSPPISLAVVPPPSSSPRRVTIGAGLAFGSDAWRSYQSKFDVRSGSSRTTSSLGR